MKRGLKDTKAALDEAADKVTTIAPMKRGLKDFKNIGEGSPAWCYNHCPDEKGTERLDQWWRHKKKWQLQPLPR